MNAEKLIKEADGFYSASAEAMCLVTNLAAALRETTAREQATIANKRIEALEHERDEARAELAEERELTNHMSRLAALCLDALSRRRRGMGRGFSVAGRKATSTEGGQRAEKVQP